MASISDLFNLVVTDAGLNAVATASGAGTVVKIETMRFGDQGYAVTDDGGVPLPAATGLTALAGERASILLAAGAAQNGLISLASRLDAGTPEFQIREVGIFLQDGTLFAVGSHPTAVLAQRSQATPVDFTVLYRVAAIGTDSIDVIFTGDAETSQLLAQVTALEAMLRGLVEGAGLVWNASNPALLATALSGPRDGLALTPLSAPPNPPADGALYLADGATWDPAGRGTGPYYVAYQAGAYHYTGQPQRVITAQTPDATPVEFIRLPIPPGDGLRVRLQGEAVRADVGRVMTFDLDAVAPPRLGPPHRYQPYGSVVRHDDAWGNTDTLQVIATRDSAGAVDDFVVTITGGSQAFNWRGLLTLNLTRP